MVKNPLAMQETWVSSQVWEDLLEMGMATHSSILACRVPWTANLVGHSPWCWKELDVTFTFSQFNEEKMETCSNLKFLLLVWFKI